MATLNDAIILATTMHKGQYDKGGHPYILHPLRIMLMADSDVNRIVAVLHDVVEDTEVTLEGLRQLGYGDEIVEAIDHLTRRESETYMEFIARTKQNEIARVVKLLDIEDNSDLSRLSEVTQQDLTRAKRYSKAKEILMG
ncbi:HD domain-containing protein [Paenibacillus harenae]|uniref:HD domain-containing protein n=1 Tax=Paenibacillus harenae TaxID=306543 RepID=UPI0027916D33|nr:HD domain-containing protein [Paenibacillus harenae]MDQ0062369.1 (p)ppGpp synthase/HD superfamily hydrolase [Paenibacillus harenae]